MVNPPGKTRPPIPRTSCCLHVPSRTNACCSHTLGLSLSRLFQPVHPSTHYPSIQPSEHPLSLKWPWREEQCIHRGWIWPLWGQVGRRSAESPLAGSTGCGHTTIPATISLFLFPSLSLSPLPRSSFVVSLPSFLSTDDLSFSFSLSPFPFRSEFTRSDNNRNSPSPFLPGVTRYRAPTRSLFPLVDFARRLAGGGRDKRVRHRTRDDRALYQAGASPTYYNGQALLSVSLSSAVRHTLPMRPCAQTIVSPGMGGPLCAIATPSASPAPFFLSLFLSFSFSLSLSVLWRNALAFFREMERSLVFLFNWGGDRGRRVVFKPRSRERVEE